MADTIPSRLFSEAERRPAGAAYYVRSSGIWKGASWAEYAQRVELAGRGLLSLGFEPGQTVSILGFNRPEWAIMDLAAMATGGAPAGIYTSSSASEVRYIVDHAESPVLLVENEVQWKKVEAEKGAMPHLKQVVMMQGSPRIDDPLVISWDELLERGKGVDAKDLHARMAALEPDGLATLIYTSGTTGPPKGVMLSHENLAWTADRGRELTEATVGDSTLSYLPLSHIAEQMFTLHIPITAGYAVYFAESMERVADNLKEVQPTLFFGVPRIWEKFHAGIAAKLGQAEGAKKKLATWAMGVGREVTALRAEGSSPRGRLAAEYALAGRLVFSKVKEAVGLGRARVCVSGAAPISRDVVEFLAGLDIVVLEVYGQSEDCGPTTFNRPGRSRIGTVGPAFPGVDVKIAEDGEILAKGPNVFLGYFKDEAATKETLVDGWLHSGDLGQFDADGFLHITGRKKDIIITAGGKNIAPRNIEALLKTHELIHEAVVIGDRKKYLTALVTLDPDATATWIERHGIAMNDLLEHPELNAEIRRAVDDANRQLARVEQVKKFTVLPRNFSIEDGELTPTLKVKRNVVLEHFARDIEAMYAE